MSVTHYRPSGTEDVATKVLLLVEDNPGDADMVRELLLEARREQYKIVHVPRLNDAVTSVTEDTVDVVLLDLSLPDASGRETVEAMRAVSDVPIVVLTGTEDEDVALSCIDAGADDYLNKGDLRARSLQRAIGYSITRRREAQIRELERTLGRYRQLSHSVTSVTAALVGVGSLRERHPGEYPKLVREYSDVLDAYLDQLVLRKPKPREGMESLITHVGDAGGGPKDLVHLHVDALEMASEGKTMERSHALAVEGRLLALEMMGLLVDFYRVGTRRAYDFRGGSP